MMRTTGKMTNTNPKDVKNTSANVEQISNGSDLGKMNLNQDPILSSLNQEDLSESNPYGIKVGDEVRVFKGIKIPKGVTGKVLSLHTQESGYGNTYITFAEMAVSDAKKPNGLYRDVIYVNVKNLIQR